MHAALSLAVRFALPILLLASIAIVSPVRGQVLSPGDGMERLTLDAATTEALDKNLDLVARRGLSIADANLVTARLRPNPVLSLGGDHLDLLGTGFDEENGAGPPEYSVRLDVLFERGRKRAVRTELAQHERAIAEAEILDAVRVRVLEAHG